MNEFPKDHPVSIMMEMIDTCKEREKIYGRAGFKKHGEVLKVFFPDGLNLETAEDFCRFIMVNNCLTKFCRYMENFKNGGHLDSIHDLAVYAALLESYDREMKE